MFLRIKDVCDKTGLSRSAIYSLVAADKFPAPRRLTPRTSAWVAEEVERWAITRPIASNADLNMKPALAGRAKRRAAENAANATAKASPDKAVPSESLALKANRRFIGTQG